MGLSVLERHEARRRQYLEGRIYNADDGKTYSATMTLNGNTMKLKGCVAGIFCKTNTFNKLN